MSPAKIVRRVFGGTAMLCVTTPPPSSRKFIVTADSVAPAFASRMKVLK